MSEAAFLRHWRRREYLRAYEKERRAADRQGSARRIDVTLKGDMLDDYVTVRSYIEGLPADQRAAGLARHLRPIPPVRHRDYSDSAQSCGRSDTGRGREGAAGDPERRGMSEIGLDDLTEDWAAVK